MASAPHKTTITRTVNNRTGITRSVTVRRSGGSTVTTRTTTIGKAKKAGSSAKKASSPAKAPGTAVASRWITGPNDGGWTMCGPVAVANHLLAVTGTEASNAAIERLYRAAGGIGDSGAPLDVILAAAASTGLAGCRLAAYQETERIADAGVLLLAVSGVTDLHAAALTPAGRAVLWGGEFPLADLDARIVAAWSLTWHGTEM